MRKRILEPEHPDIGHSLSNIGATLHDLGELNKALDYNEKALMLRKKIFNPPHADLATSLNNMGAILRNLGKFDEALDYLK